MGGVETSAGEEDVDVEEAQDGRGTRSQPGSGTFPAHVPLFL